MNKTKKNYNIVFLLFGLVIIVWMVLLTIEVVQISNDRRNDAEARADLNMNLINKINEYNIRIEELEKAK